MALVVVVFGAVLYTGDELFVRYRLMRRTPHDPLDAVAVYLATRLKDGRVEIYQDEPETEVCVHALFPHLGHRPCWYVSRHRVKVV